uniref:Possible transposase n=1 Tax=Rhodopseudomonas palustris (strain ATCC BAA-98 / CGA009) TaxID=258594 RepID=Q6NA76_RHOPA|nr:possible transposase [Rhodopseudomonas palustris CGA009]
MPCSDGSLVGNQGRGGQAGEGALVSAARAAVDLDVHESVLRKWAKQRGVAPVQAVAGHGQMKPEQREIVRLRRKFAKLQTECDIPKKAAAFFAKEAT